MKTMSKITLGLFTASLLFVGCGDNAAPATEDTVKPTISEASLGLRKTNLYTEAAETIGDTTQYSTNAAGSGKTLKRAFQDAPPMIPHDVNGMLPITLSNNACTSCHSPETAPSMGALPYPPSHMTDFRPATGIAADGKITKNGTEVDNTSSPKLEYVSIKKLNHLSGARYSCTLCHAPQSADVNVPKNNFEAVYSEINGAEKSSWSGTKLMEGIDTIK
ncbi:nitrate reductase cytochrome c-type subunit [Sulfurimonas sp.]|uniref:nitrate reductase cytochrome c-type subunit n=1 Tax=Sulfurimonas sp. TaxID=2022749 RepID=UPI002AB165B5|nr:nitrate reductase cytochrome c-type subunit [Sulfurimonas sp.]